MGSGLQWPCVGAEESSDVAGGWVRRCRGELDVSVPPERREEQSAISPDGVKLPANWNALGAKSRGCNEEIVLAKFWVDCICNLGGHGKNIPPLFFLVSRRNFRYG
jgi:hypothetical protein